MPIVIPKAANLATGPHPHDTNLRRDLRVLPPRRAQTCRLNRAAAAVPANARANEEDNVSPLGRAPGSNSAPDPLCPPTDDVPLYGNPVAQERDVINFNHLRKV